MAGPGQVVVRVAGTSFNILDFAIRAGILRETAPVTFPHIPNCDMAGVVTEVGEGVSDWNAGDAVVAFLPSTAPGAAAEYVAAPAEVLATALRTVDLADAAALPLAGLTAWQALFEHAALKPGQRILVNGAGGGVGGYAVQLAAQTGATVTTTASPRSHARVRAGGADQIVDYTTTPGTQQPRGNRPTGNPRRRRRRVRQHHHARPVRHGPRCADGAGLRTQRPILPDPTSPGRATVRAASARRRSGVPVSREPRRRFLVRQVTETRE